MGWLWVNSRSKLVLILWLAICACQSQKPADEGVIETTSPVPSGKLLIIGGGSRGPELYQKMISASGLDTGGYAVILPMSSSEPDSSIYYAKRPFTEAGIDQITGFNFQSRQNPNTEWLDSLRKASLIYISGGDQRRFMEIVEDSPIGEAIKEAWQNGALVAGTSAGAAVMSKQMITGDQKKHPEYESTFSSLQADNIILEPGLGFLDQVIIDQHFVARSRYNRLLTAIIEMPEITGIGIEESTAIFVQGDSAEVVGKAQVIVFENPEQNRKVQNGLLGAENLSISVYLPGEKFHLKK